MTTPTVNTLALVPPRRPTEDDFGGAAKIDKPGYAPNPATMPTAAEWNEKVRMIAAGWRTAPVGVIPVTFIAGAPTIGNVQCGNSALLAANFTPTDHGVGDTTIAWAADTFPPAICPPAVIINMTTGTWLMPVTIVGVNQVRIQTPDVSTALADANFTLFVY